MAKKKGLKPGQFHAFGQVWEVRGANATQKAANSTSVGRYLEAMGIPYPDRMRFNWRGMPKTMQSMSEKWRELAVRGGGAGMAIDPKAGGTATITQMVDALKRHAKPVAKIDKPYLEKMLFAPLDDLIYGKGKRGDPRGGAIPRVPKGSAADKEIRALTKLWLGKELSADRAAKFTNTFRGLSERKIRDIIVGDVKVHPQMLEMLESVHGMNRPKGQKPAIAKKLWAQRFDVAEATGRPWPGSWSKKVKGYKAKRAVRGDIAKKMEGAAERAVPTAEFPPAPPAYKRGQKLEGPKAPVRAKRSQVELARKFVSDAEKTGLKRARITKATKGGKHARDAAKALMRERLGDEANVMFGMQLQGRVPPGRHGELSKDVEQMYRAARRYLGKATEGAKSFHPDAVHRVAAILMGVAGKVSEFQDAPKQEALEQLLQVSGLSSTEEEAIMRRSAEIGQRRTVSAKTSPHPGESRYIQEEMGFSSGQGEQALTEQKRRRHAGYARGEAMSAPRLRAQFEIYQGFISPADVEAWGATPAGARAGLERFTGAAYMLPDENGQIILGKDPKTGKLNRGTIKDLKPSQLEARHARLREITRWKLRKGAARRKLEALAAQGITPKAQEAHYRPFQMGDVPPEGRGRPPVPGPPPGFEAGMDPTTGQPTMRPEVYRDPPPFQPHQTFQGAQGGPPTRPVGGGPSGPSPTSGGVIPERPAIPQKPMGARLGARAIPEEQIGLGRAFQEVVQKLTDRGVLPHGRTAGQSPREVLPLIQKALKARRIANPGAMALLLMAALGVGIGGVALGQSNAA